MDKVSRLIAWVVALVLLISTTHASAQDIPSTVKALRLANTITGGLLTPSDPLFAQMVAAVQANNMLEAANIAARSRYFATYMARRLALQMQTPTLDAGAARDNDATAFLIALFVGGGGSAPSISQIWSRNATYEVNVTAAGTTTRKKAADLTAQELYNVNWMTDLVEIPGQTVNVSTFAADGTETVADGTLPVKHVGGYTTLSDRGDEGSFAQYGATAGTNLRYIEGIWQIATGLGLMDVASTYAPISQVPRFIPLYDPNFFVGDGQPACSSCHGGGMSSIPHGYSTVADVFEFDTDDGLVYYTNPPTGRRKSLGSDPGKRNANNTCNLQSNPTPVCNPDSSGVDPNHGWNLQNIWGPLGVLNLMGWTGPSAGQGLNELGRALGQARIVYEYLTKRIATEVCPSGKLAPSEIASIAKRANPNATPAGTDDVRTLVAHVAVHASCQ